jgi:adenylate kinase
VTSAASENANAQSIRLVIFGRQGAGKGTQCERLSEHYQITHVSTGDMLRGAADAGTPFGLQAKEIMDRGELVPDDVMIGLVNERLHEDDCSHGFLLDGFPRTLDQVDALNGLLAPESVQLALNLDVPEDVVMERMLARGREDDTPDAIRKRLDLYEAQTAPLLHWYSDRGLAVRIDGVGTEDEVAHRLVSAIDSFLQLENS